MSYTTPYIISKGLNQDTLYSPTSRNVSDLYYELGFLVEDHVDNWTQAQRLASQFPEFYSIA